MAQARETIHPYRDDAGDSFEAFVVTGGPGPAPTVLLTHDWSGFNDGMREVARKIAALGYTAFGLDLYGVGRRGDELGDNTHLMQPLLDDRGLIRRRLLAGVSAARAHPAVAPDRLAVLGYCFGGLCALDLARANPDGLRAAISVHGVLTPPSGAPSPAVRASVMVLHGWEDPVAPRADFAAFADEMTASGADWHAHVYGHAMHAFTFPRADMPEKGIAYNEAAAVRADQAIAQFLHDRL